MSESLFNKVAGIQACNISKKWLQRRCFPANIIMAIVIDTDESEGVTELSRVNCKNIKWKNSLK